VAVARLGVAQVLAKDEGQRLLGSFKSLGGTYAGLRALARAAGTDVPALVAARPAGQPALVRHDHGEAVMLANFVQETANAPGSATTINLAGPPTGRRGFLAAFASGASVYYFLDDGTQSEWGVGTVTAGSPNTLSRTSVLGNTAGTTARLNFTGTTRVYNELPAERVFQTIGGTLTGDVVIDKSSPILTLNKPAGTAAVIDARTAGALRWRISMGTAEAESGGNAGSNLVFTRWSDGGVAIEDSLSINRANGVANFAQRPMHVGVPLAVQSTGAEGVGQVLPLVGGVGAALNAPAGGAWDFQIFRVTAAGAVLAASFTRNVAAGGQLIGAAVPGEAWVGFAKREA
jgi:hypothetical protein